jgi:predicted RNA methylase
MLVLREDAQKIITESQIKRMTELLLSSKDFYDEDVKILEFAINDNGSMSGNFKDLDNNRVFEFAINGQDISYKPRIKGRRDSSNWDDNRLLLQWEVESKIYLKRFPESRFDARKKRGKVKKKPKCSGISYNCGKRCLGVDLNCRVSQRNNKSKQRLENLQELAKKHKAGEVGPFYANSGKKAKEVEEMRKSAYEESIKRRETARAKRRSKKESENIQRGKESVKKRKAEKDKGSDRDLSENAKRGKKLVEKKKVEKSANAEPSSQSQLVKNTSSKSSLSTSKIKSKRVKNGFPMVTTNMIENDARGRFFRRWEREQPKIPGKKGDFTVLNEDGKRKEISGDKYADLLGVAKNEQSDENPELPYHVYSLKTGEKVMRKFGDEKDAGYAASLLINSGIDLKKEQFTNREEDAIVGIANAVKNKQYDLSLDDVRHGRFQQETTKESKEVQKQKIESKLADTKKRLVSIREKEQDGIPRGVWDVEDKHILEYDLRYYEEQSAKLNSQIVEQSDRPTEKLSPTAQKGKEAVKEWKKSNKKELTNKKIYQEPPKKTIDDLENKQKEGARYTSKNPFTQKDSTELQRSKDGFSFNPKNSESKLWNTLEKLGNDEWRKDFDNAPNVPLKNGYVKNKGSNTGGGPGKLGRKLNIANTNPERWKGGGGYRIVDANTHYDLDFKSKKLSDLKPILNYLESLDIDFDNPERLAFGNRNLEGEILRKLAANLEADDLERKKQSDRSIETLSPTAQKGKKAVEEWKKSKKKEITKGGEYQEPATSVTIKNQSDSKYIADIKVLNPKNEKIFKPAAFEDPNDPRYTPKLTSKEIKDLKIKLSEEKQGLTGGELARVKSHRTLGANGDYIKAKGVSNPKLLFSSVDEKEKAIADYQNNLDKTIREKTGKPFDENSDNHNYWRYIAQITRDEQIKTFEDDSNDVAIEASPITVKAAKKLVGRKDNMVERGGNEQLSVSGWNEFNKIVAKDNNLPTPLKQELINNAKEGKVTNAQGKAEYIADIKSLDKDEQKQFEPHPYFDNPDDPRYTPKLTRKEIDNLNISVLDAKEGIDSTEFAHVKVDRTLGGNGDYSYASSRNAVQNPKLLFSSVDEKEKAIADYQNNLDKTIREKTGKPFDESSNNRDYWRYMAQIARDEQIKTFENESVSVAKEANPYMIKAAEKLVGNEYNMREFKGKKELTERGWKEFYEIVQKDQNLPKPLKQELINNATGGKRGGVQSGEVENRLTNKTKTSEKLEKLALNRIEKTESQLEEIADRKQNTSRRANKADYAREKVTRTKTNAETLVKLARANKENRLSSGLKNVSQLKQLEVVEELDQTFDSNFTSIHNRLEDAFDDTEKKQVLSQIEVKDVNDLIGVLKEYRQYKKDAPTMSKVESMERELIGNKNAGIDYFPTPPKVANRVVEKADIKPGMTVLEPSAGNGAIADAVRQSTPSARIATNEISGQLVDILEAKGYSNTQKDFLSMPTGQKYDRIVMNPPFGKGTAGTDQAHIRHAYEMLSPNGRLVAVASEGSFSRSDRNARDFQQWVESIGGEVEKVEPGAFKSSINPTGTATRIVTINKGDRRDSENIRHGKILVKAYQMQKMLRS